LLGEIRRPQKSFSIPAVEDRTPERGPASRSARRGKTSLRLCGRRYPVILRCAWLVPITSRATPPTATVRSLHIVDALLEGGPAGQASKDQGARRPPPARGAPRPLRHRRRGRRAANLGPGPG